MTRSALPRYAITLGDEIDAGVLQVPASLHPPTDGDQCQFRGVPQSNHFPNPILPNGVPAKVSVLPIDPVVHESAPSNATNIALEQHIMTTYPNTGNFHVSGKTQSYTDYLEIMGEALRRTASRIPGGIKAVAAAANCNVRTLEGIAQKRNGPNGFTLWQLQTMVPGFEREAKRLAGFEDDPEFQKDLSEIMQRAIRRAALRAEN